MRYGQTWWGGTETGLATGVTPQPIVISEQELWNPCHITVHQRGLLRKCYIHCGLVCSLGACVVYIAP